MKNTKSYSTVAKNDSGNGSLPSKELNSILIGLILSDAGLYRSSPTSNTRLEMSFGQAYKEFAYFIGELLSPYISNPVKSVTISVKDKTYTNYRLKTKTLPMFNHYFDMFYKLSPVAENSLAPRYKYIKIVPGDIMDLMDPIVLAYLIMSDGNFDQGRKRVRIYTNCFTKQEVELLKKALENKFNIKSCLQKNNVNYQLYIKAESLFLLKKLVLPYVVPSLRYKLGIKNR